MNLAGLTLDNLASITLDMLAILPIDPSSVGFMFAITGERIGDTSVYRVTGEQQYQPRDLSQSAVTFSVTGDQAYQGDLNV